MPTGIAEDNSGNVYYGEYSRNLSKEGMNIYKSTDDGRSWEGFYSFGAGDIRHIHAVQYDRYSNNLWVTTGDKDKECLIGYFSADTGSFITVGSGSQAYRAVSLLFTEDYVYWGMDSPDVQDYVFRYARKTNKIDQIQLLDGPAYYSTALENGRMFISTTCEKEKSNGDNMASIWTSFTGEEWERVFKFKRNPNAQSYTVIRFPRGNSEKPLIFNVLNAKGYSNDIFVVYSCPGKR